ncbi:hypothetical protein FBU30_004556 [Linnemannia zychae]|nr:hypothetical protein FBU30_004556 [Linnemannia zychae]
MSHTAIRGFDVHACLDILKKSSGKKIMDTSEVLYQQQAIEFEDFSHTDIELSKKEFKRLNGHQSSQPKRASHRQTWVFT